MSLPAIQTSISDIIEEYDEKKESLERDLQRFNEEITRLKMQSTIQGTFAGSPIKDPYVSLKGLHHNLLVSAWKCLYNRINIDVVATANDKKLFERSFEDPPELTFDNVKATFGDYVLRPRYHILRGLAEVFTSLDPAYKSHSNVKIGVKGLPKRIIISDYGSWGSYGRERLNDIINSIAAYRNQPLATQDEFSAIENAHSNGEDAILDGRSYSSKDRYRKSEYKTLDRGITIRKFNNGNAHVIFDKYTLLDINRALNEFYGDVLPDVEEENVTKQQSTSVSKDLQYYPTPKNVVDILISDLYIKGGEKVLEPSCGCGRILDELREKHIDCFGIEYHPGRAQQARSKGHKVYIANFLECPAKEEFDFVVMNPPFYGKHYLKHIKHALDFLKVGGTLVSVLPATAWYDHKDINKLGTWRDLPVGSFNESGTNVPTGVLKVVKK